MVRRYKPLPDSVERRMTDASGPRKKKRPRGVQAGDVRGPYKNRGQPRAEGQGRQKGTPNHFSRDMKERVIRGIESFGRDGRGTDGVEGFVWKLCKESPNAAAALLRAVLPLELKADFIQSVNVPYETLEEAIENARKAGIPEQRILDLTDYYLLPPPAEIATEDMVDRPDVQSGS